MAEFASVGVQTVNPGESVVFNLAPGPCNRGLVIPRLGSGNILLRGWVPNRVGCSCNRSSAAQYRVTFDANIGIPTGGTVETISLAYAIDGGTIEASTMDSTPGAVEDLNNVSRTKSVAIVRGCCQTLTVRNITDQPILVSDPSITIDRPDLSVTY